jgi:hypothetical protein
MTRNLHIPIGFAGDSYSDFGPTGWSNANAANGVSIDLAELSRERLIALCIRAKTATLRLEWSTARPNPIEGEPDIVSSGDTSENFARNANSFFLDSPDWDGLTPPPWIPLFTESGFLFGMPGWVSVDSEFEGSPGMNPNCTIHEGKFYSLVDYVYLRDIGSDNPQFVTHRTPSLDPDISEESCVVTYTDSELKMVSHARLDSDADSYEIYDSTITFTITSLYDP